MHFVYTTRQFCVLYILSENCFNFKVINTLLCQSQWPRGLRCRSAATRLLSLWARIPPRAWIFVCCECCQVEVSATSWSLVQRSPTVCGVSCLSYKPREWGGPGPLGAVALKKIASLRKCNSLNLILNFWTDCKQFHGTSLEIMCYKKNHITRCNFSCVVKTGLILFVHICWNQCYKSMHMFVQ
jgi:hypothetical protein